MSEHENPKTFDPILPRPASSREEPRYQRRSLFWPVVLIGVGVILLLSNLGIFPENGWAILWRFWPLALIALGIDVLMGRRSLGGAIAGGVLVLLLLGMALGAVFFAEQVPVLMELGHPAELHTEHIAHPLNGAESAKVSINWPSRPGYLYALEDSANLIEGDIAYYGQRVFRVNQENRHTDVTLDSFAQGVSFGINFDDKKSEWRVGLNPNVALDLWLDSGSGSCNFDLTGLAMKHLNLDSGSGSIHLTLPDAGNFSGDIDSGSGSVTIILPKNVGLRVELDDGSGSFDPGGRLVLVSGEKDDDGVWETENYDKADYQIELDINQGSGSIRIE